MKRKCIMAMVMLTLVMTVSGCGNGQKTAASGDTVFTENEQKEDQPEENGADTGEDQPEENGESIVNPSEGIFIGGKVRSVSLDSFVLSRTLVDDDGMIIAMPEEGSPEEELVTVRCTASTVFERWMIQGGGAGIEKASAAFSELKEGIGLEAQGYFDGEEFIAGKVIIEIYE